MAMSLPHQIGAISGTAISSDNGGLSGETAHSSTVSASAIWRSPMANLRVSAQGQGDIERVSPLPSPPLSPVRGGAMRADMSLACKAFATEMDAETIYSSTAPNSGKKGKGVPVFVMMPLDSVKMDNTVNRRKAINASMQALKSAGVEGVMMDVWWGLVERDSPGEYNWGGYLELLEMAQKHGLKVQAVMSFHQCGGNVGDSCALLC